MTMGISPHPTRTHLIRACLSPPANFRLGPGKRCSESSQTARRIAFSVLISNTDDHLRNHAFLHVGGDKWQLSPAFDINPNPEPGPKELTCAIDEYDSAATVANLYKVSEHFRLDAASARAMLTEVVTSTQRWRKVARHLGLSGAEIEHMAPAFEHPEATVAAQ